MTDTPLSNDVLDAAMRAFGDTEIVGGPPSFTKRAMANAIRAALEAARYGEMVKLLGLAARSIEIVNETIVEFGGDEIKQAADVAQMARALLSSIGASQP